MGQDAIRLIKKTKVPGGVFGLAGIAILGYLVLSRSETIGRAIATGTEAAKDKLGVGGGSGAGGGAGAPDRITDPGTVNGAIPRPQDGTPDTGNTGNARGYETTGGSGGATGFGGGAGGTPARSFGALNNALNTLYRTATSASSSNTNRETARVAYTDFTRTNEQAFGTATTPDNRLLSSLYVPGQYVPSFSSAIAHSRGSSSSSSSSNTRVAPPSTKVAPGKNRPSSLGGRRNFGGFNTKVRGSSGAAAKVAAAASALASVPRTSRPARSRF